MVIEQGLSARFDELDNPPWQTSALFYLCAFVMAFSLVLGGGTHSGFLSDAILQFAAVPLLLAALWLAWETPFSKSARQALRLCLAIVLLPFVQLVPLPPQIWTLLPGRAPLTEAFELIGSDLPWMPLSVSPRATWLAALSMLPAVAIFLGTVLLNNRGRRSLSVVMLAAGILSVFLGLMQVAQGPASPLRFFEFTNPLEAVGFFANRNHFAAFLYAVTLFAAAWTADAALTIGSKTGGRKFETSPIVALAAGFTILVALVAAQAIARSRAGLGLTIVAMCGASALAYWDGRGASGLRPAKLLTGALSLAALFAIQFGLYRILERFSADPMADGRLLFFRGTAGAAQAFMPFGSGIGTFVNVYGLFERPQDTMIGVYANRAHNDILELWLETGIAGIALMAGFAAWLIARSLAVWRGAAHGPRAIDVSLARAATIVLALLIVHSFVDYPLRTGAMMTVMAFACALLIEVPKGAEREEPANANRARARFVRGSVRRPVPSREEPAWTQPLHGKISSSKPARGREGEPWDQDIEWPEEWRKPPS